MKQIIRGTLYNTETARVIVEVCNHFPRNDFRYKKYTLYRKKNGEFFKHGVGGPMTEFAERVQGTENAYTEGSGIIPVSEAEARDIMEDYCSVEEYEAEFGKVEE